MAKKRRPKDFNYTDVKDKDITDPEGLGLQAEYPKHLHKFVGFTPGGDPDLEFKEVGNAKEEADAKRQGYGTAQEAHAAAAKARGVKPAAAKAKPAKKKAGKPRNPKPKPVAGKVE